MKNSVILKSFPNGISVILDGTISFQELLADIGVKFREADGFFKDASVAISIEGRELTEEQEREILDAITQNSRLKILCLMGKDEEKNLKFLGVQSKLNFQNDENSGQFYRGTLKDGASIETEHSIIILGDVCEGSCVYSNKDIVVLGTLTGDVYAGAGGTAIILLWRSICFRASFRLEIMCTTVSRKRRCDGDLRNLRLYRRLHIHAMVKCRSNLLQKNCWTILPCKNSTGVQRTIICNGGVFL